MSNVAANSIFAREDQLDLFMSMYLAWRHSNGAGASQPNAWGPPVLAPPRMRSMSPRNLCANSRQALPGTDDGASQPANPSKAAEKKLAGAAKNSFIKKCEKDAGGAGPACASKAVDKNGKALAGAAKNSFIKKCEKEAAVAK